MKQKKCEEKKSAKRNWATAQLSCEKKKNCIARERAGKKNCIAIVLQEKGVVGRIVLQAKALYCN